MMDALRPGRVVGLSLAILCFSFALMTGGSREAAEIRLPEALPTPGTASSAAETGQRIRPDCVIIQTMGFTRCGHSVTRRISPPDEIVGAYFSDVQVYYDVWNIESFSESDMEMHREIGLFCPMHWVLTNNEAGEIILSRNVYGDGMAVEHTYGRQLTEFAPEIQEDLRMGIGFSSREEAEAWLGLH